MTWECPECAKVFPSPRSIGAHSKYCPVTRDQIFWSRVNKNAPNGCWEWIGYRQKFGHGYIGRSGQNYHLAHRYAWKLLGYPLKDSEMLLHKCDNPPCVNPAHLFIGDDAANSADKWAKGRGAAKLNAEAVRDIRSSTLTSHELAAKYGVQYGAIWAVRTRRKWKHVT